MGIRVALIITTHKRPQITRACFAGVERAIERFRDHDIDLVPFIAVSDKENREIAQSFMYRYWETNNTLLGQKHNVLLEFALQEEWDFMLQLGSDDFLLDEAIDKIAAEMHKGTEFGAFQELYVASPKHDDIKYFKSAQCFGAGRFFSRRVVEKVMKEKGVFWTPEKMRALDGDSSRRVTQVTKLWPKVLEGCAVVDVKGENNLNGWHKFKSASVGWSDIVPELALVRKKK